ncbi:claudin-34-like [Chanos chanos]|uniref:Claudin-34-like n=1 Tax=Chanos chanos TaxID=29144 RepID=A0A6J2V837_CHACN|nr:claudin-34-like [Chanos chanos]
MTYLVHTAHAQFVGLWLGVVGWTLTIVTIGLVQWRVWVVDDLSVITSGLAWVGIWRVCFYSHVLVTSQYDVMFCQKIAISDAFTPADIAAAQVLMLVALILGLVGNAGAVYGLRNIYFGLDEPKPIRLAFSFGGALFLMAGLCSSVPVLWNLNSVVTNQTIHFPSNFHMPPAPVRQYTGGGIAMGMVSFMLMIISGIIFLSYRFPVRQGPKVTPQWPEEGHSAIWDPGKSSLFFNKDNTNHCQGRDNRAFQAEENV